MTFHENKDELHGMTCVFETTGSKVYVGRYDFADDQKYLAHDVDIWEEGHELSREEYLKRAYEWGVFVKHKTFPIPKDEVSQIKLLKDCAPA